MIHHQPLTGTVSDGVWWRDQEGQVARFCGLQSLPTVKLAKSQRYWLCICSCGGSEKWELFMVSKLAFKVQLMVFYQLVGIMHHPFMKKMGHASTNESCQNWQPNHRSKQILHQFCMIKSFKCSFMWAFRVTQVTGMPTIKCCTIMRFSFPFWIKNHINFCIEDSSTHCKLKPTSIKDVVMTGQNENLYYWSLPALHIKTAL